MLVHFFLLRSIPWFINDDGNIDGLFYMLMIATQICQQVSLYIKRGKVSVNVRP